MYYIIYDIYKIIPHLNNQSFLDQFECQYIKSFVINSRIVRIYSWCPIGVSSSRFIKTSNHGYISPTYSGIRSQLYFIQFPLSLVILITGSFFYKKKRAACESRPVKPFKRQIKKEKVSDPVLHRIYS